MHTSRYCPRVAQKSVGWWTVPGTVSSDPTVDAVVIARNEERFPGWRFTVTFAPDGTAVGFAVESDSKVGVDPTKWPDGRARHHAGGATVTARWLRGLPIAEIQAAARAGYVDRLAWCGPWGEAIAERWATAFAEIPRPGRRGRDDRAYAEMAALYVEELATNPRSAVKTLALRLSYADSQVRSILSEARRRGLLTRPPRGRAGGELTSGALELLRPREVT
jgi:hypothetical protein